MTIITSLCYVQLVTTAIVHNIEEDDDDELDEKRNKYKKLKLMKNNYLYSACKPPQIELYEKYNLWDLVNDENRNYMKIFTSLYYWEFYQLAMYLRPFIETARIGHGSMGSCIKKDYLHRFYYVLFWLDTRTELRQMEFYFGWSKSQIQLELRHLLLAIIKGLDSYISWPNMEERKHLASMNNGILKDCIGIIEDGNL